MNTNLLGMKKCSRCSQEKEETEFRASKSGKRHAYCIPCQKQYLKEHYVKNREKYLVRANSTNENAASRTARIKKEAKDVPCADCGIRYPSHVMDFDHVKPGKVRAVSLMSTCSKQSVLTEISKCEVVCSNCHRERTYQRRLAKDGKGSDKGSV